LVPLSSNNSKYSIILKIVTEKVHTLFLDIDNYQRPKISAIIFDLPRNKCFVDVEVLDLYRQIDFQSMTALAQVSKDKLPLASLNR